MMSGKIPETIEDFELLCDHYGLNSVWMGRYALDEICKGRMRWEEWLPDGLHPSERGSLSYAQSVIMFLEKALSEQEGDTDRKSMPAEPLDPLNWENTEIIPFEEMTLSGSWIIQRSLKSVFIDRLLSTSVPGAKVCLEFEGRGAVIGLDFGKRGADLRCFVDGEEKKIIPIEKAEWMPENGWFTLRIIDDCLEYGRHFLEIETVNVSKVFCSGTNCDIAFVGIIK